MRSQRDYDVRWRFISLALINANGRSVLRVATELVRPFERLLGAREVPEEALLLEQRDGLDAQALALVLVAELVALLLRRRRPVAAAFGITPGMKKR